MLALLSIKETFDLISNHLKFKIHQRKFSDIFTLHSKLPKYSHNIKCQHRNLDCVLIQILLSMNELLKLRQAYSSQFQYLANSTKITTNTETAMMSSETWQTCSQKCFDREDWLLMFKISGCYRQQCPVLKMYILPNLSRYFVFWPISTSV